MLCFLLNWLLNLIMSLEANGLNGMPLYSTITDQTYEVNLIIIECLNHVNDVQECLGRHAFINY